MKAGTPLVISHKQALEPLVGTLADVTVAGEEVRVRIKEIGPSLVSCIVVDKSTRE